MAEHPIQGMMGVTIDKIREMVDTSTIIGDPIKISETLQIIPVSKVTYGFASGGTDFPSKSNAELFGGGSLCLCCGSLCLNGRSLRALSASHNAQCKDQAQHSTNHSFHFIFSFDHNVRVFHPFRAL